MRKMMSVAGLAFVLAACGGEKAETPAMDTTAAVAPVTTDAPAATGTTHEVQMVLEGSAYKYIPENLTVKAGDKVVFKNASGGPHNVQFEADKLPAGAAAVLDAAMVDRMGPVAGPLLAEPDATYEVSFAGAPVGAYPYFCLPHQAMGMKGVITVE